MRPARWSNASVALHWLGALLIFGLVGVGFVMADLPPDSPTRVIFARMHTVGGATLMVLTLARLAVRLRGPTPSPLPLPELHRRGLGLVHALIYVVIFAIGASGFFTATRTTWHEYVLGELAQAPSFAEVPSREAHEILVFALIGLLVLHVGGVIVQQLRHGRTIERMLPHRAAASPPEPPG